MIMKAFLYPEAPEDWLPLRIETLNSEIDKKHLIRLIKTDDDSYLEIPDDHQTEYTKIGLSVSPNLVSYESGESAWGTVCLGYNRKWQKVSGFSDMGSMHHNLYGILKEKYIPTDQWPKFKMQKKLINYFIQVKRNLYRSTTITDLKEKYKEYFPLTYKNYLMDFNFVITKKSNKANSEGVALQIILDKNLADQITYNSHPFGWLKDDSKYSKYSFGIGGKVWEGDEIQPYSEFYVKVKNHKDGEQARLALTNDFRRYPSRVRIKSIAGIMENPVDYDIVKSMIREMVNFKTGLKAGEDSEAVKEEKPKKEETKPNLFDQLETTLYGFF